MVRTLTVLDEKISWIIQSGCEIQTRQYWADINFLNKMYKTHDDPYDLITSPSKIIILSNL